MQVTAGTPLAQPSVLSSWAAAGFGAELVPVCGPNHDCGSPGKRPHLPGWQTVDVTPALLARWERDHRGNIGLRTRGFPCVDIDVDAPELVKAIEVVCLEVLGPAPARFRANSARRALLYRLEGEPFDKAALNFTTPDGVKAKVEILADGQQVVVAGRHASGADLEWTEPPQANGLACFAGAQVPTLLAELRRWLEEAGCTFLAPSAPSKMPAPVPLRPLADDGAERALRRARAYVSRIPPAVSGQQGHSQTFDAACRVVERVANEGDAWALLVEWNQGCRPPWSEKELRHKLSDALEVHHLGEKLQEPWRGEQVSTGNDPAGCEDEDQEQAEQMVASRLSLDAVMDPPRETFIFGSAIPLGKSSVFYGPTSIGKSALLAQILFCLAAGTRDLWGLPLLPAGGPVLVFSAEDSLDDWVRKAAAIRHAGGIDIERALDRFYVVDQSEGLARLSEVVTIRSGTIETISRRTAQPTVQQEQLIATARRVGAKAVLLETASRLVEDEDNANMSALQSSAGRVARETGAAVILSHHVTKAASKDGDASIESARGGGAFVANSRNALALFPADPEVARVYGGRFPAEDVVVLSHQKATSSTRRQEPLTLIRCDARWGAVFQRPDDVALTPEQEMAIGARLEAERSRERESLARLYDVVGRSLPTRPLLSPSWLRENAAAEVGVSKHRVEPLVRLALDRGVLRVGNRTQRGVTVVLGLDPREPICGRANAGESPEVEP